MTRFLLLLAGIAALAPAAHARQATVDLETRILWT